MESGVLVMKTIVNLIQILLFALAVLLTSCSSPAPEKEQKSESPVPAGRKAAINVDECFKFVGEQLSKSVEQIKDGNQFPRYTKEDGTWVTVDSHAWSSGFFAGCLWYMYEHTGEEQWANFARTWTAGMEMEKFNRENHNNGFMMFSSFGNGYRLTGDKHYREVLIESARSLASRYSDSVGAIKANEMPQWKFPVMVDTMVNIQLLFWAARNGGDPKWAEMAETHALNTARDHIREDGGTVQIVDYDPETGEVIGHDTLCGLSGDSAWSRDQGQALYGFTRAYIETRNPILLEAAQKVADFFVDNFPDDYVPYWDFSDPDIPDVIRDSSAASIAAAGLLELCTLGKDIEAQNKYKSAAVNIIDSLCSPGYLAKGTNSYGILKHATWKKPTDPQADTSLIWGDYNFLEALLLYKKSL